MSKKLFEDIREMLCNELNEVRRKGELTTGGLDIVEKLTHSIKSIDTIIAMDEGGYSERMYDTGTSYARGRTARRDSMGRYSRRARGYSRDGDKEEMVEKLRDIWEDTDDTRIKSAISKCIEMIED